LFDMEGNIIGVHSRIGGALTVNLHVPVQAYRSTWDRLVASEAWGYTPGQRPYIGVQGEAGSTVAKVSQVFRGSAADKAGVRVGDVIVKFADKEVTDFESLKGLVEGEEPGRKVPLEVLRDENRVRMEIVVGRQRD